MKRHFAAYPKNWGLATWDRNTITDVPNPPPVHGQGYDRRNDAAYQPGDIVSWSGRRQPHRHRVRPAAEDGARPL
jgi:uncharacterized protein YijF (DUF1287 family)